MPSDQACHDEWSFSTLPFGSVTHVCANWWQTCIKHYILWKMSSKSHGLNLAGTWYENYVVYLHVYHVRSCSPTPTYKQPLYGCQPDEPQASLATTNRCNHVYVVLFFILLFMYAVIHGLYSVGNKITTTTTTCWSSRQSATWPLLAEFVDTLPW